LEEKGITGMEFMRQEQKRITTVKAQAHLKAGKTKKSAMPGHRPRAHEYWHERGFQKRQLRSTCAELDLTNLLHKILGCQDRLDAITKRRQSLVTKKRGIYTYTSSQFTT
jgi:hypothetical protein